MKKILSLMRWQSFLIIISPLVPYYVFSMIHFNNDFISSEVLSALFGSIGVLLWFGIIMFIGFELNKKDGSSYRFSNIIFIITLTIAALAYCKMHFDRLNPQPDFLFETGEIPKVDYISSFILAPVTFFCLIYPYRCVSKSLRSHELGREAIFSDYIHTAILFFVLPIGIWFLQPKIKRILQLDT